MLNDFYNILKVLNINETDANKAVECIIMYLRKSRKDDEFFKNESIEKTLERHEQILQQYITNALGVPIPEHNIYREVASGDTIEDRPVMQKILRKVEEPSVKALLCIEVERLGRGDGIDQGTITRTLRLTKTKFMTPMKIFDLDDENDLSFFEDSLYQSRKYLQYTKKILKRGRTASAMAGKWPYSHLPFGYIKEKIAGEKGYKLVKREIEFEIGQLIGDLYLNGIHCTYTIKDDDTMLSIAKKFGIPKLKLINDNDNIQFSSGNTLSININDTRPPNIANYLNYLNIGSRSGKKWTNHMVTNILFGEAQHGYVTYDKRKTVINITNGKETKSRPVAENYIKVRGLHEAMYDDNISKKIFEKKERCTANVIASETTKNPLSGLVVCSVCGNRMQRRPFSYKIIERPYMTQDEKIPLLSSLREAKEKSSLSLNDISKQTRIEKGRVDHYFAFNIKKFVIPTVENWNKLDRLLNINRDDLKKKIIDYHEKKNIYHCDSLTCNRAHCETVSCDLNLVEERILSALKETLKSYKKYCKDYETIENKIQNSNAKMINILKQEIKKNKQQLDKACELIENGIYTKELYVSRTAKINANIKSIENKIKELEKGNDTEQKLSHYKKSIPALEYVIEKYSYLDDSAMKNELLKKIIDKVIYTKKKGGKKYKDVFEIEIKMRI